MTTSLTSFLRDESGATAIEYGLIAALVCIAAIGAMMAFADNVIIMYNTVSSAMSDVAPP